MDVAEFDYAATERRAVDRLLNRRFHQDLSFEAHHYHEKCIVRGYYGSCSGCDAYEGECGYGPWDCDEDNPADPAECAAHKEKIAEFGRSYFDSLMTPEEAVQGWLEKDAEYLYGDDFEEIEFLMKFLPEGSPLRQQALDHMAKAKERN